MCCIENNFPLPWNGWYNGCTVFGCSDKHRGTNGDVITKLVVLSALKVYFTGPENKQINILFICHIAELTAIN